MAISKRRQNEILQYALQGDHDRQVRRKMMDFLATTQDKNELHLFAQNWNWDGDVRPLFPLIKNPHCDAGTLLFLYWYGCPEDNYLFNSSATELDDPYERDVFRLLRQIERKIVKSEYNSSLIPFDPTNRITMWDRRHEFARPIPDIMYQPITARRKKK